MTGVSRRPRCRLDLLHPDISHRVRERQQKQKAGHDCHCYQRTLAAGQPVWLKNQGPGLPWLTGTITRVLSPQRFSVLLDDGRTMDRHIDHLRPRVPSMTTNNQESTADPIIPNTELFEDGDTPEPPRNNNPTPAHRRSNRDHHPPDRYM